MNAAKRTSITIAAALIAVGLIVLLAAGAMTDFSFSELNTLTSRTETYLIGDAFRDIRLESAECDIRLIPTEEDACTVRCTERDRIFHTVEVVDGVLTVTRVDDRRWYERLLTIDLDEMEIAVYLPERVYGSLYVETLSGDISIPNGFSFTETEISSASGDAAFSLSARGALSVSTVSGDLTIRETTAEDITVQSSSGDVILSASAQGTLSVSTVSGDLTIRETTAADITAQSTSGDVSLSSAATEGRVDVKSTSGSIKLSDLVCRNIISDSTSGRSEFIDVTAAGHMQLESVSGDIILKKCDAATLYIQTSSGDISGTLLSEKIFFVDTVSGDINLPTRASGGKCEIQTVSGSVDLDIAT